MRTAAEVARFIADNQSLANAIFRDASDFEKNYCKAGTYIDVAHYTKNPQSPDSIIFSMLVTSGSHYNKIKSFQECQQFCQVFFDLRVDPALQAAHNVQTGKNLPERPSKATIESSKQFIIEKIKSYVGTAVSEQNVQRVFDALVAAPQTTQPNPRLFQERNTSVTTAASDFVFNQESHLPTNMI